MTHAYTRMPVSLRMALVYAQDATPEMRELAQRYIQHPTAAQFARALELELEPMPGDARTTGAEDRALYPFHADVQGLGVCPDALLLQPGVGADVETLEMYRDRHASDVMDRTKARVVPSKALSMANLLARKARARA